MYDKGYRHFRNIDDYECYVDSYEIAQCFLHELESTLREYDLPLNFKKTNIEKLPIVITEKWIHKLKDFIEVTQGKAKYKDVNAILDLALELTNAMGDAAVLKYAVKVLAVRI